MTLAFLRTLREAIAIDLGTANILACQTNILACQKGRGIVLNEPSVVAIISYLRREHRLLVGEETVERIKVTIGSAHPPDDGEGREMVIRGPRNSSFQWNSGAARFDHLPRSNGAGSMQGSLLLSWQNAVHLLLQRVDQVLGPTR